MNDTLMEFPLHLWGYEKRREMLYKHLRILQNEDDPELVINLRALEKALPDLLSNLPAWVGIGGDGQIFCSESRAEVIELLRASSSPPWLRIQL